MRRWTDAAELLRYLGEHFLFDSEHPYQATPVPPNARTPEGDTPLHVVARWNDAEAIALLIGAGAYVNAIGDMGETPLHIAAKTGDRTSIQLLLQNGADPSLRSEFGQTAEELLGKPGSATDETQAGAA
jgi:ankyrin repeat protein